MPTTIPYDPSLVLANIVDPAVLDNLKKIGKAQNPPDKAHDSLNALLMSRRSLDMTRTELLNLGIDVTGISEAIKEMDQGINEKAQEYATLSIAAEKTIAELRANVIGVKDLPETPVDLLKTEVKIMPLASDTINMDVQYFSMDTMNQDSTSFANQIAGFVSASTSWMGSSASTKMSSTVQTQVSQQSETHEISGTLVISVSCSHKDAAMLAPCILNVDKAIKVWNHFHPLPADRIEAKTLDEMKKIANPVVNPDISNDVVETEGPKKYSILSGVTYGSSFVGMVHILNNSTTFSSQSLSTVASSLQGQMDIGGWFAKFSGGFGVDASFSDSVKSLLSSQNVMSHVSMACMGCIPSIVANEVQIGVKQFADFDPKADMEALASYQNSTAAVQESIGQSAEAARTGQQMVTLQAGKIKAAIGALANVDDGKNKVLDVNSLMTALEDYVQKVNEAKCGVPINYYLKDITRDMLADMWIAKYFPGADGPTITYDDQVTPPQNPPENPPENPEDEKVDNNGSGVDEAAAAGKGEEAESSADAGDLGKEKEAESLADAENAPELTM